MKPSFSLYFAVFVLIGNIVDIALTYNEWVMYPQFFYIAEQNEMFKNYVGTNQWYIPRSIIILFSLFLIVSVNHCSNIETRTAARYFGVLPYICSFGYFLKIELIKYYNFVALIVFTILLIRLLKK